MRPWAVSRPPRAAKGSARERAALAQYLAARRERERRAPQGAGSLTGRSDTSGDRACTALAARKIVFTNDMFEGAQLPAVRSSDGAALHGAELVAPLVGLCLSVSMYRRLPDRQAGLPLPSVAPYPIVLLRRSLDERQPCVSCDTNWQPQH